MNWMVCKLGAVPFNEGINRNTVKRLVFHILARIIFWSIKTGNSIASESGLAKRKCLTVPYGCVLVLRQHKMKYNCRQVSFFCFSKLNCIQFGFSLMRGKCRRYDCVCDSSYRLLRRTTGKIL